MLANCCYEMESVEEMAVHVRITGYSDKLFDFAQTFLDIMFECAKEDGFEETQVINSIEKIKSEYANSNLEVGEQATNNRLLFLLPHTFHASHMETVLG